MLIKYENQVSSYISVSRCGFSSANLAHQKFKPVMLLSQVKLAGNVCHKTLLGTDMSFSSIIQCNSFYVYLCDEIFHNSTTPLPLS